MRVRDVLPLVLLLSASGHPSLAAGRAVQDAVASAAARLTPTAHAPISTQASDLWLAPDGSGRRRVAQPALTSLAGGVKLFTEASYAAALPMLSAATLADVPLGNYALYYLGLTQLRQAQAADARETFASLSARQPLGYLAEAAALAEAEAAEAQKDYARAFELYGALSKRKPAAPHDVLMRLGRAALAADDSRRAADAFARVYYEFPLTDAGEEAAIELSRLGRPEPLAVGSPRFKLELGRAERLFGARRYPQARTAFEALKPYAEGDDRELVSLRLAESDFYLKRYGSARDLTRPYLQRAARRAEALFFHLTAIRELGDHGEYLRLARQLLDSLPSSSWTEEALNNLASHYVVADDDEQADVVFREYLARFPEGRYAERAAWKSGWWAYKHARYAEAARTFEEAAGRFPRSDYRPSYLYWAARARDQEGDRQIATDHYRLVVTDYRNSYYGRLAWQQADARGVRVAPYTHVPLVAAPSASDGEPDDLPPLPPTAATITSLLALELYDDALNELQFAQRTWGDSPIIQATIAYAWHKKGDLRRGINTMRRAYPQYMAAGGERLPAELLRIVFPVNYWSLIREHATARRLDPYLIAALIAQESTFTADIRSVANAIGLMQVVPATGRRYARSMGIRGFSARSLERPEINVRIGMKYFADLTARFGGAHYALASYNAGEHRVARWIAERPGLARDEFIDDIPFPETQNYVKRILGTADDYRRLYAGATGSIDATPARIEKAPASAKPAKPAATRRPARKRSAGKRPPR